MTAPRAIEPNFSDSIGAKSTAATKSVGKFDSVLSGLSYTAGIAGPAAWAATAQYAPKSADIVGAAVNATAGYGSMGMMPGGYSGGAGVYFGGGMSGLQAGVSTNAPMPGSSPMDPSGIIAQGQQQLAQSQASSMAMMMLQDQQSNQNRVFTTASNLMSARDSMISNIMRNVRGQ